MNVVAQMRGLPTAPREMLTQAAHHGIQYGGGSGGNPRVLRVKVVCSSDDEGQQHGVDALFQDGKHLCEGLQRPLVHFLVGIVKPWGENIKDLLTEQKITGVCGLGRRQLKLPLHPWNGSPDL